MYFKKITDETDSMVMHMKLYSLYLFLVRDLESRIHDMLFDMGTTPVMQATQQPEGAAAAEPSLNEQAQQQQQRE